MGQIKVSIEVSIISEVYLFQGLLELFVGKEKMSSIEVSPFQFS